MTWLVVQFLEENNIEVVPTTWVTQDDLCFWPPANIKADYLIKTNSEPCSDWIKYKIKLMCRKPFDKLSAASIRASKACEMSDFESSSTEIGLPPKRKIRRPKHFSSSEDETQIDEDILAKELVIPPPPSIITNERISKKNTPAKSSDLLESSEKRDRFQEEVIKILVEMKTKFGLMQVSFEKLQRQVDLLVTNINESNPARDTKKEENLKNITKYFPLTTPEHISIIEADLKNDETRSDLVRELSKIGGNTFKDCGRRIMERCISRELAAAYSFRGHKGKKDFSKLSLSSVIVGAVRKTFNDMITEKDVESTIAVWLAKVPLKLHKDGNKSNESINVIQNIIDAANETPEEQD